MLRKNTGSALVPAAAGWVLIGVHYFIFSQFFPNAQGKLGHDYEYNLPLLLDGYYWFLNNGLWPVPWFTPSFCGGMPLLANPATFYVSAAQLFTFFTDPLVGVRLTLLLFAALGFWGFYFLLAQVFKTSKWTALLGGTIFLFNGLFAYRFVVGHLEFHSFMLTPLIAFFLLKDEAEAPLGRWQAGRDIVCAALLISYAFMSGMTQLIVPSLIAVLVIALLARLEFGEQVSMGRFVGRLTMAGIGALGLSAAKLVAALSFLSNFPRDSYLLPGVDGLGKLLLMIVQVLSVGGGQLDIQGTLVNVQWMLERHEFEFGLSVVPFALILAGVGLNLRQWQWRGLAARYCSARQWPFLLACLLLLSIPLALNYYSPAWNSFLKTVPFIKSLSNFFRWFIIYIPFVVVLAALAVEKTSLLQRHCLPLALAGVTLVVAQNLLTDQAFYHAQFYDPANIVTAYYHTKDNGRPPVIANQVVNINAAGQLDLSVGRNDALVNGGSPLLCYEPMFGFQLEYLPFKTIQPGPVLADLDGLLNLKNPACYLYPDQNQCAPGDHFTVEQRAEAERFTSFQPFAYQASGLQKAADWLNLLCLLALPALALGYGRAWLRARQ